MLWTNFSRSAAWKRMLFTVTEWRSMHKNSLHWLFEVFPFLNQNALEPDELHVFYMGGGPSHSGQHLLATHLPVLDWGS
eukprot:12435672-Alexandrium_andersonii.AAC.1